MGPIFALQEYCCGVFITQEDYHECIEYIESQDIPKGIDFSRFLAPFKTFN